MNNTPFDKKYKSRTYRNIHYDGMQLYVTPNLNPALIQIQIQSTHNPFLSILTVFLLYEKFYFLVYIYSFCVLYLTSLKHE